MDFTSNPEPAAQLAADLANSLGSFSGRENLGDVAALRAFLDAHAIEAAARAEDLPRLHELRARFIAVFQAATPAEQIALINDLLAAFPATPRLQPGAERPGIDFTPAASDVVHEIGARGALGLAYFFTKWGFERIGTCECDDCNDAYVDSTKNRMKRFCSTGCARLASTRAFRARKRAATTS